MHIRQVRLQAHPSRLVRNPFARLTFILTLLAALVWVGGPQAFADGEEPGGGAPYRDGIVLLAFRDGTPQAQREAILANVGAHEIKQIGVGVHVVAVKSGQVPSAIRALQTVQAIRYAEPDYLQHVSAASLPNDTYIGLQWAVQNTGQNANGSGGTPGADESTLAAWGITTGTNSVVIAETDTGIQYTHPDLITNMWNNPGGIGGCSAGTHGYNVLASSCDPMDDDNNYGGHGTHVAGIMGAVGNDSAGTAGINWTTSIMAIKWVDSGGNGATSDLITGLDWVVSAKQSGVNVRVVNDSQTWAGTAYSQALSDEIDVLGSNDILFVTASGNTAQDNDTTPRYPCSYNRANEICVAASDQNDNLWGSANWGPNSVQLAAPGVNIYSTLRNSDYGYISGGSMASPQVAGAAALILSLGYQSVSSLRSMILNHVDVLSSLSGLVGTGGRLNVCKAVPGCSSAASRTPANTIAPVITSIPQQGWVLGASTGAWSGIPSRYSYQWSRCSSNGSGCNPITGATGQTYALLAPQDVGATLRVTVTGANSSGSAAAQSAASGVIASHSSPSTLTSSVVSGTNISGSVNWTVTPARSEQFVQFFIDGVLVATDSSSPYSYSLDTTTLVNGAHVLGARALYTDNRTYDFYGETVTVANPPVNSSLPTISGSALTGQTLSTTNGSWSQNSAPTSFSYQWERCDSNGMNCSQISGASGSTYLLKGADVNSTIRSSVTGTNAAGSVAAVSGQTLVVTPGPLVVSTASLPAGTQNIVYSGAVLSATGGVDPYTWAITSGTLPGGLTLNPATGAISGTPAAFGTSNFVVQATDSNSTTATKALSIIIAGPPSITTTTLPSGTQYVAYSATLSAANGTPPYSWSISSGALPAGLTLASSTGMISGNPTVNGTTNFTAQVSDSNGLKATMPLSISLISSSGGGIGLIQENAAMGSGVGSVSVSFPEPNTAGNVILAFVRMSSTGQTVTLTDTAGNSYVEAVGQVQDADHHQSHLFYAANVAGVSGNTVTATFSSTNNHPFLAIYEYKGLSASSPLDQTASAQGNSAAPSAGPTSTTVNSNELVFGATGLPSNYNGTEAAGSGYVMLEQNASGSPAANESLVTTSTGAYTATFALGGSASWSAIVATFIGGTPSGPAVSTSTLPNAEQNVAYTATLAATGGVTPYSWSISSGTLPAGLSLASGTGVISGTPTAAGTSNFTVQVTDANSLSATAALSLTVTGPPSVTTASLPNGLTNTAYSATLTASGGTAPDSWSITSGTLPPGLTLAASTGVISGTPTATGTSNFTVQVTDANSSTASQPLSITVFSAPSITTTSVPGGEQSVAYSTTLAASGGTTPYAWSITVGTLPAGLSLASGTGAISGTPTGTGTSNFTVQVKDANSLTATKALSLTVAGPPTVSTTSLPNGSPNVAYSATLAATGGTSPYSWSIMAGTLPAGLTLTPATGAISGTPTAIGTSNFTVQVTDANSLTASQPLTLIVSTSPSITTTSLPGGTQNVAYSTTLAASGGTTPYAWSITVGTLPAGLSLASGTGAISGTPTGTGTSNFTVQVKDANSSTATQALALTIIGPPSITTTSLPAGTKSVAYSTTLTATGGAAPYSWSVTSGTLPTGLTLASSTGVISGTPTATGTANFTVQVQDANALTASKTLSLTINTSGGSGIGLVQENAVQGSGVGSVSVSFAGANTAGNLILAFVRMSSWSQTLTLSDTAGNTYIQAVGLVQNADGSQVYLYYAPNIKGSASNKVTATFSSTNNHPFLAIFEYKGLNASSPLDQTASAQGFSTTPNSGPTGTTTSANELIFAAMGLPASYTGTQTAGNGFTFLEQDKSTSPAATASELATSTGSFAASFTLSGSANWSAIIATFKP